MVVWLLIKLIQQQLLIENKSDGAHGFIQIYRLTIHIILFICVHVSFCIFSWITYVVLSGICELTRQKNLLVNHLICDIISQCKYTFVLELDVLKPMYIYTFVLLLILGVDCRCIVWEGIYFESCILYCWYFVVISTKMRLLFPL